MIQEEARLKLQAEREEADRRYRADEDRKARDFQAEQAALADQRHNQALKDAWDREKSSQSGQWKRMIIAAVLGGGFTLAAVFLKGQAPITVVVPTAPATQAAPK
jgi:hypothetical protein